MEIVEKNEDNRVQILGDPFNFDGSEVANDSFDSDDLRSPPDPEGNRPNLRLITKEYGRENVFPDNNGNLDRVVQHPQDERPKLYVPSAAAGVLLRSGTTYEDIIELVNINPHASLLDDTTNGTIYEVYNSDGDADRNFEFRLVYGAPAGSPPVPGHAPEFIDVNQLLPKEEGGLGAPGSADDDVVFVTEYPVGFPGKAQVESDAAAAAADDDDETNRAKSRRRKRRRNYGEKRKNPVRKAQIDKASADLVEKLAIPHSVFNARVKRKKPRQAKQEQVKIVRQSARTTGAIRRSPVPFTRGDFKVWPENGMHERPFYNERTKEIEKNDYAPMSSSTCGDAGGPTSRPDEGANPCPLSGSEEMGGQRVSEKRHERFSTLTDDRIRMLIGYTCEAKKFEGLRARDRDPTLETSPNMRSRYEMLRDSCVLHKLSANLSNEDLLAYFSELKRANGSREKLNRE